MSKIRVVHVLTSGLRKEGIASTQLEFFKRIDQNKFNIIVAAVHDNEDEMIEAFKKNGCEVVVFPDRKRHVFKYFIRLMKYLKDKRPEAIHVHGSSAMLSVELLAARLAGVKIRIAHSRNTKADNARVDAIMRPIFKHLYTDAFACGVEAGRWLFGNKPFIVLHNGKDMNKFCFNAALREQKRDELKLNGKIVIGHVGRFNHQKNHEYLLKVFEEFVRKQNNAILYLMGDGPMFEQIQKQVKNCPMLLDKVIFTGGVSDVAERLQAMDIMVFPSKYEGLPNVVLEWQAEGLPCLISDKITKECALSEFVEFASIEDDPQIWAEKMEQMLIKFVNREIQAKQGTQVLKENGFDIVDATKQLEDRYLKLIKY